jgi:opacity protein-like surface antigen
VKRLAVLVIVLLASAGTARAQIRVFGDAGLEAFTAKRSFNAVLGKSTAPLFGGGLEFDLHHRMFLSVAAARMHRTGHRVFVYQNQVFTLNEPADVTMTPLDVTGGFRVRRSGLVPYLGGGAGWLKYQESSPHSVAGDAIKISHVTYHALAGLEVPMARWLAAAVEAQYTSAPNALGNSPTSVAAAFNEHNLGGFTTRVKVIIGR